MTEPRRFWTVRQIRAKDIRPGDVFEDVNGFWTDNQEKLGYHGEFDLIEIQVIEAEDGPDRD